MNNRVAHEKGHAYLKWSGYDAELVERLVGDTIVQHHSGQEGSYLPKVIEEEFQLVFDIISVADE